jgi:hypothetical protein
MCPLQLHHYRSIDAPLSMHVFGVACQQLYPQCRLRGQSSYGYGSTPNPLPCSLSCLCSWVHVQVLNVVGNGVSELPASVGTFKQLT